MARSLVIEEESGTCRGWTHPHNGYYAGDFSIREGANAVPSTSAPSRRLHVVAWSAESSPTASSDRHSHRRTHRSTDRRVA